MVDITSVGAALTSIKTATDLAKLIKNSDLSLENAEVKLQMAELIGALAEAKIELADLQDEMKAKEDKIKQLEESFLLKEQVVRYRDAFYKIGDDGNAIGEPFCLNCWAVSQKLFPLHLEHGNRNTKVCSVCNTKYQMLMTPNINPDAIDA